MEPISFFLDSFIQLGQRIITLEKTKREDKQQVFKEIIEPLFVQFEPVAENYILIFRKAKQDIIKNPNNDLSKTLDEIRELREKMQLARRTVQAMAVQINRLYKDEKIRDFAENIADFFDISLIGESGRGSLTMGLVERIEKVLAKEAEMNELVLFIFASLNSLEQNWNEIGQSYALTKIYCLSAPHLMNKPK